MAYRSSAMASSASGGNLTATPAGVTAHDYLSGVYIQDTSGGNAPATPPTAWNARIDLNMAGPDGQLGSASDKNDASGSDSFQWTCANTGQAAVINAASSGRNNTAPRSATPVVTLNTGSSASPISASYTGITATAADDILVFKFTDQITATDRWTFSAISSYTEKQDGVAVDWVSGIALDIRDNVSAGATGSLASTITRSGSGNAGYGAIVFAIAAAAGGGISGDFGVTLAALALASAGTLPIAGASAPTLGALTLTSASVVALQSALAQTLGALTLASAGGAPAILGVLAQTLGAATLSSAGTIPLNGTLAQTLGSLALASASVVPLNAQLSKALDALVLAAAGSLPLSAALAQTLGVLTLSSASTLNSGITGTAGVTLGDATASSQATLKIIGQLSAILSLLSLHSVPPQTGRLVLRLLLRGILRNVTRLA